MTSKKTAASKRASLPRAADYAKDFLRDWERLERSGRFDMKRLKEAMILLIANEGPLGPQWLAHPLKGDAWNSFDECHVGGDFLLVYQVKDKENAVRFVRAGTHNDIFGR
jgi:mRNA interferase YafQ